MLIKVTEEDIKEGRPFSMYACPLAIAVKRSFNTQPWYRRIFDFSNYSVAIGQNCIRVNNLKKGFTKTYDLSEDIKRFVMDFDNGFPVKPIEFELVPSMIRTK